MLGSPLTVHLHSHSITLYAIEYSKGNEGEKERVRGSGEEGENGGEGQRFPKVTCIYLAIHGFLDNAATFDEIAPLLVPALPSNGSTRFVAVDLAGHGRSGWRASGTRYHFVDWVADIAALVRHFQVECPALTSVHLIGHSLGGSIALTLTSVFPDLVKSLVLIDSLGVRPMPPSTLPRTLRKALSKSEGGTPQPSPTSSPRHETRQAAVVPRVAASAPLDSLAAAAERRSSQNMVGDLPVSSAMRLARRGCRSVDSQMWLDEDEPDAEHNRVFWAQDNRTRLASLFTFTTEQTVAIAHAVHCRTLLVTAADSPFGSRWPFVVARRLPRFARKPYALFCRVLVWLAGMVVATLGLGSSWQRLHATAYAAAAFVSVYAELFSRSATGVRKYVDVRLPTGGHHLHLTQPVDTAQAILDFLELGVDSPVMHRSKHT
jgi:pimeloyl-ACP methyl ester carboxylesterase